MKLSLNNDVGYGVNLKPKYFVLLPDLSTSTTRRKSNIFGSIKTKLQSTLHLLSNLVRFLSFCVLFAFLLQLLGGCLLIVVMYVQLILHCHSWFHCYLSQSNQLLNFLIKSLLCQMDQTFQTSYRKPSNLQSLCYIEMRQALRAAR